MCYSATWPFKHGSVTVFGFARKRDLKQLRDHFESLECRLLGEWKEWRQQLRNSAARLERATQRDTASPSPAQAGGDNGGFRGGTPGPEIPGTGAGGGRTALNE